MNKFILRKEVIVIIFAVCVVVGTYFWRMSTDKNQAHVIRVLNLAREITPISIDKIKNLLIDYTVDNDIKKTTINFLQKTIKQKFTESNISPIGENPQKGLSGDHVLLIRDNQDSLKYAVKIFDKPFDLSANFIKELAGFQVVTTIPAKSFNLIAAQAVGTCILKGKKYGLLATTPATGITFGGLLNMITSFEPGTSERLAAFKIASCALKKLGTALANLHLVRAKENAKIHHAVIDDAAKILQNALNQLRTKNYGVDLQKLEKYFDLLVGQMMKIKTTRSIIHGDAHVGNFLYDAKADSLFMVDITEFANTIDEHGNPIKNGAFDFVGILCSLELYQSRLSPEEYTKLRKSFLKGYGSSPTDLEQEFFTLVRSISFVGWFLDLEKKNPEKFDQHSMKNFVLPIFIDKIKQIIENSKHDTKRHLR